MFCHNCGKKLEEETKFCSNCGDHIKIENESMKSNKASKNSWYENFKWWHILVVSLLSLWVSGMLQSGQDDSSVDGQFIFSLIGDIGLIFSMFLGIKTFRDKRKKSVINDGN